MQFGRRWSEVLILTSLQGRFKANVKKEKKGCFLFIIILHEASEINIFNFTSVPAVSVPQNTRNSKNIDQKHARIVLYGSGLSKMGFHPLLNRTLLYI